MYYFWGYIEIDNGKYVAMLSRKNPDLQLSLKMKDWRLSLKEFSTPREAIKHGERLIRRYRNMY